MDGEPSAVKVARSVRRGGYGDVLLVTRHVLTLLRAHQQYREVLAR